MVEMEILGVRVEMPGNNPIVLLREKEGERRTVPIFIGGPEATAIDFALNGVETARPMTHDLMKTVLDELGTRLERVVITELRAQTFYAELHLVDPSGTRLISSRPSDAIALAVRTGSPIFAAEEVVEEAHMPIEPEGSQDSDEVVEQFREFIDNVSPEDFAS